MKMSLNNLKSAAAMVSAVSTINCAGQASNYALGNHSSECETRQCHVKSMVGAEEGVTKNGDVVYCQEGESDQVALLKSAKQKYIDHHGCSGYDNDQPFGTQQTSVRNLSLNVNGQVRAVTLGCAYVSDVKYGSSSEGDNYCPNSNQ